MSSTPIDTGYIDQRFSYHSGLGLKGDELLTAVTKDMEAETLRRESASRPAPQPSRDATDEDSRPAPDPNRAIGLPTGRSAMAAAAKLLG